MQSRQELLDSQLMDPAIERYARDFAQYPRLAGAWESRPFRVRYLDLHLRTLSGPYSTDPHLHPHYEMILVEAGDYRCLVNGHPVRLHERGIVLLTPGDQHEECGTDWVRYQGLSFACLPGPTPECSFNILADPAIRRITNGLDELFACTARLAALGAAPDPWTAVLQDAVAEELLWRLVRKLPVAALHPSLQEATHNAGFTDELHRVFAAHPGGIGVTEIATALNMPVRSLTARCQDQLGASPARLYTRYRMGRARELVTQSDRPLAEIAAALGFADQFHFSKVYKRVHGLAPLAHRRKALAGSDISRTWADIPE
jgi:AraC-like DNA-binding protein